MHIPGPFRASFVLILITGCGSDRAPWPPPLDTHVQVADAGAARASQAFFDTTWPAIQRTAAAYGFEASDPQWYAGVWVTPEERIHGYLEQSLWFDLTSPDSVSTQMIWLELVRRGREEPWRVVLHDGFLQARIPREGEDRDTKPEVIGIPALEVALRELFPYSAEWLVSDSMPTVRLREDTLARVELATFLSTYDSAIRAALDSEDLEDLDGRYRNPYTGLGVAPVDSLDEALGLREGSLDVRVVLSRQDAYIPLHFARAGRGAPWKLLEDGDRIPRGRSPFHVRARAVQERIRRLFPASMPVASWDELRTRARTGAAPVTVRPAPRRRVRCIDAKCPVHVEPTDERASQTSNERPAVVRRH